MRLTLRTLLAYLDDTLEPADKEEIRAKLQESPVATALANRIGEALRGSLSAPDLDGPGCDIDPNILAEYLENTLPPDQVVEVEKLCLTSEQQLSEVAACHQILSRNFDNAVEIRQNHREWLYRLSPRDERSAITDRPAAVEEEVAVNDWYCQSVQIGCGPHSFDALLEFARRGDLSPEDSIRLGDKGPWRRAGSMGRLMVLMPYQVPPASAEAAPSLRIDAAADELEVGVRLRDVAPASRTAGKVLSQTPARVPIPPAVAASMPKKIAASAPIQKPANKPSFDEGRLNSLLKGPRVFAALGGLAALAALVLLVVCWDYVGWIFLVEGTGKFRAPYQELMVIYSDVEVEVNSNPPAATWKAFCDQTKLRMNSTERGITGLHSGLDVNAKLIKAISELKGALGSLQPQEAERKLQQAQRHLDEAAKILKL